MLGRCLRQSRPPTILPPRACGPHFSTSLPRGNSSKNEDHGGLAGTVAAHTSYILLNTRVSPELFPSKVPSKLQRTLQLYASQFGGIVNFAWTPPSIIPGTEASRDLGSQSPPLQKHTANPASSGVLAEWESDGSGSEGGGGGEQYSALAFSVHRGRLELPLVSMQNMDEVVAALQEHALPLSEDAARELARAKKQSNSASAAEEPVHLYVCTHGQRDCRCGETGGAVFDALRAEVARRDVGRSVKVGSVGHVGGHKYAANVLVFPYGEWLGYVRPENAAEILERILSRYNAPFSVTGSPPICRSWWRGRMGLNKEEQLDLFDITPPMPPVDLRLRPHTTRI